MKTEIRDYPSRLGDEASKRLGTYSYLPEFDEATLRRQVLHMVQHGWNCAIEHVEPTRAGDHYWYLWKLPMFGERDPDVIIAEIAACADANPHHHVRLLALDNLRQTQGLSLVVARARMAASISDAVGMPPRAPT